MALIYNGTTLSNNDSIMFNGTRALAIYVCDTATTTCTKVWPSQNSLVVSGINSYCEGTTDDAEIDPEESYGEMCCEMTYGELCSRLYPIGNNCAVCIWNSGDTVNLPLTATVNTCGAETIDISVSYNINGGLYATWGDFYADDSILCCNVASSQITTCTYTITGNNVTVSCAVQIGTIRGELFCTNICKNCPKGCWKGWCIDTDKIQRTIEICRNGNLEISCTTPASCTVTLCY
jgi:hypothetical protein